MYCYFTIQWRICKNKQTNKNKTKQNKTKQQQQQQQKNEVSLLNDFFRQKC